MHEERGCLRVALVGDYDPSVKAHQAILRSLELVSAILGIEVRGEWIGTETLDDGAGSRLSGFRAIWCVPASPYRSFDGALAAIRHAREGGVPFLGTCGGFQHAVLEYARNVLERSDAGHAEIDAGTALPLIAPLACAMVEKQGRVAFAEGSRLRSIYGAPDAIEGYHCSYGLNPEFEPLFNDCDIRIAARDDAGEVRAIEIASHPFFIATLFQPERAALEGKLPPLALALAQSALNRKAMVPS